MFAAMCGAMPIIRESRTSENPPDSKPESIAKPHMRGLPNTLALRVEQECSSRVRKLTETKVRGCASF